MEKEYYVDRLKIKKYSSRKEMGAAAAVEVGQMLRHLLEHKELVSVVFASAPSQNEFLDGLRNYQGIDWSRVVAFHMDEYIGLEAVHPQSFAYFLNDRLFSHVPISKFFYIDGCAQNVEEECKRYEQLLKEYKVDIVCMGIGENTHIAFNDPHVADFSDPKWVKVVDLDEASRRQQVNDGCFERIEQVPTHALTLTIPALLSGAHLFCIVPGKNKAIAVQQTLYEDISELYPSTVLRKHDNAILYLDAESASRVVMKDVT
ncbi:Glucosamine-6-phosphate deaminase [Mycovorax composti]|uniref:Glucosamine-6-phosphate deaminase n=1 Tax=Mycovorax composti TaxID=2962693 RepID=A0ABZ2EP03_9BACT